MPYSYDRYETQRRRQTYGASSRRTTLGYWVPLAITVTAATIGLAAWIWSERKDHDDEDDDNRGDERPPPTYGQVTPGQNAHARGAEGSHAEDESMMARMSGALRRTPSPQQLFDGASRRVVAGVAAAGAAVGGALSSIREEDKRDFEDHSRWSEEPQHGAGNTSRQAGLQLRDFEASGPVTAGRPQIPSIRHRPEDRRKAVAIVISAERKHHGHDSEEEAAYLQEHASILSHLPEHIDGDSRLFVLIYAPDLTQHPLASKPQPPQAAASLTSSYSNIGQDDIHTPNEEHNKPLSSIEPHPISTSSKSSMFDALYAQAQALVEKDTMIMPFTTPSGYVHLLRHIAPEMVYVQETLSGPGGDAVLHIAGWVGQVVLVVGDESGHGGLVDSEDERGTLGDERRDHWWHYHPKIGLGKGIEVVEGLNVGDHWRKRVRGHD
ncbi:MAG: hypothetical protein Q9187_006203 [Circinaria calcarea]